MPFPPTSTKNALASAEFSWQINLPCQLSKNIHYSVKHADCNTTYKCSIFIFLSYERCAQNAIWNFEAPHCALMCFLPLCLKSHKKHVFLKSCREKTQGTMLPKVLSGNAMKEIAFLGFPRVTSLLSLSGICFGPAMGKINK